MNIKKIKFLTSEASLGHLNFARAQVGSNGYGFVFFIRNDRYFNSKFWKVSSKVCGAGAHFGSFEKFMTLEEIKFNKLSGNGALIEDIKHDLLLAGSLRTLLPDIVLGGDEILFDSLMFIMTPDGLFFPATFYYGASGTAMGGWDSDDYNKFPKKIRNVFNFSPFDLDKDGLTGLVEAQMFALRQVPISDFCGIYGHALGNALMCVHNCVAFFMELGYDNEFDEHDVEIMLNSLGYDFEKDKFNYREMVKRAKEKPY